MLEGICLEKIEDKLEINKGIILFGNALFTDEVMKNEMIKRFKESSKKEVIEIFDVYKLYCMYEFSNNICLISNGDCFGSVLNYVETGILTLDEAVEIFLK